MSARSSTGGYTACRLFLKYKRWSADPTTLEGHTYFDAVGDFDERNTAVHAELFAVERHGAFDLPAPCALATHGKAQGFGFGDAADREGPLHVKCVRTGLHNFCRVERNVWIIFGVEEVFALQFVVFHAASGIHGIRVNLDVQHAGRGVRGRKGQRGFPLTELTVDSNRSLYEKLNIAFFGTDGEDRTLGSGDRCKHGRSQKAENSKSHGIPPLARNVVKTLSRLHVFTGGCRWVLSELTGRGPRGLSPP